MNKTYLSKNIHKFRKIKNFSQTQIARMLFVTPQTVSKWENGLAYPDIDNLCSLADIFGVSVDSLLGKNKENDGGKKYIGIDGGGTKTDFVLFDEKGIVHQRVKLEGSSITVSGEEKAMAVLKKGIDTLLEVSPEIEGIFAGISGCYDKGNNKIASTFLKRTYPHFHSFVMSDIMNVIGSVRGASDKCIAVISGTGSVVFSNDGENLKRTSGYGYFFDMAGSGFAIGRDVIREALMVADGLKQESLVSKMATDKFGKSINENINEFYLKGANFVASFAPIAEEAAKLGDEAGLSILKNNLTYLGQLIGYMQKQSETGDIVVFAGGISKCLPLVMPFIMPNVKKTSVFKVPTMPPVYGACTQCLRKLKVEYNAEEFDKNFEKTLQEF